MAGPQVSWDMTDYSLTNVPAEKSERLAFGQSIPFIGLSSRIWERDISPIIEDVDGIQRLHTELLSSWTDKGKIHSSSFFLPKLRLSYG